MWETTTTTTIITITIYIGGKAAIKNPNFMKNIFISQSVRGLFIHTTYIIVEYHQFCSALVL